MNIIEQILILIPDSSSAGIPWDQLETMFPAAFISGMKETQQNPVFHGEGDVYTHTKMVCSELIRLPAFRGLPDRQKAELFLAAYLHDIGKIRTTKEENGILISPHHAGRGSRIARDFLWREWGIGGTPEEMNIRETICLLTKYHMLPIHLIDQKDPERKIREVAAAGELAKDFSWDLLCLLAEADVRGRIADDTEELLTKLQLTRIMAEETGCLHGPCHFGNAAAKRAYLSGRNVQPDQELFDDSWGEVILLSGLPGTGKDTWVHKNVPELPVISLDGIRAELGVRPTDNQGRVIQLSRERAREYLRNKQPFVWNATNLTREVRRNLVGLFEQYGARVRIVYLETDYVTRSERNYGRSGNNVVPENVVQVMLTKTEPPTPDEAQTVEWRAV